MKTKALRLLILAIVLATVSRIATPKPAKETEGPIGAAIDGYLSRLEGYGFSGSVLVARHQKVLIQKGYGLADRTRGLPVTADTALGIASLDKQFTAAAILCLEMQGKLKVTDPIKKYLSAVPVDKTDITIHQLLTHTSGLANTYRDELPNLEFPQYIEAVLRTPLEAPPGKEFIYSNTGYDLLAWIIERVSGMSYEKYLAAELFTPAGLVKTGLRLPRWRPEEVAQYQDSGRPDPAARLKWAKDPVHPFLSMRTTVADLYRWHLALSAHKVLSPEATTRLLTVEKEGYAYGWNIGKTTRGTTVAYHGGSDSAIGLVAAFHRYLDEDAVIIVLCNTAAGSLMGEYLVEPLEKILFGGPVTFPPAADPAATGPIWPWAGRYQLPDGAEIEVIEAGGQLIAGSSAPDGTLVLTFPEAAGPGLPWQEDAPIRSALEALDRGDAAPLQRLLWPDVGEGYARRRLEGWRSLRDKAGAFKGLKVLHRVSHELADMQETHIFVLAEFEKGRQVIRLVRDPEGRYLLNPFNMPETLTLPLARLSADEFAGWNFRLLMGPHLKFLPAASGMPVSLQIGSSQGAVIAKRKS
jgi:CubicO group peptidase (beta-lactamase class C family)